MAEYRTLPEAYKAIGAAPFWNTAPTEFRPKGNWRGNAVGKNGKKYRITWNGRAFVVAPLTGDARTTDAAQVERVLRAALRVVRRTMDASRTLVDKKTRSATEAVSLLVRSGAMSVSGAKNTVSLAEKTGYRALVGARCTVVVSYRDGVFSVVAVEKTSDAATRDAKGDFSTAFPDGPGALDKVAATIVRAKMGSPADAQKVVRELKVRMALHKKGQYSHEAFARGYDVFGRQWEVWLNKGKWTIWAHSVEAPFDPNHREPFYIRM